MTRVNKLFIAILIVIVCIIELNSVAGFVLKPNNLKTEVKICDSQIYCHGELLHTVQMAKLFNDSKTFVDMKLKQKPDITLKNFREFMNQNGNKPSQDAVRHFVETHFDKPGSEFIPWNPTDWTPSPSFLNNIKDKDFKKWASDLNVLWKILGRQMTDDVAKNPDLYSIIHVDNPLIVPGGRFREFYYWDSYWIIRGLLYSEMNKTAKGMLENFLSIIERFNYIPNGGRIYYERSHPPLLTGMVKSYAEATNDTQFLINALPTLEKEFNFFLDYHMVDVNGFSLATYGFQSPGPRPESYREDYLLAQYLQTEQDKENLYQELKGAAESGMDFTSRWFLKDGTNKGNLTDTKIRSIVPVELNAFLYWNAKIIAEYYALDNNARKAAEYERKALNLYLAIQAILWNEKAGVWLDYDLVNNKSRNYFVPTNLSPLWVGCFNQQTKPRLARRIFDYVNNLGLDIYPGGVPNTLLQSGEQWDYPNVWAPMQYIIVEGLRNLNDAKVNDLAYSWTSRWVRSNFIAYNKTEAMYEKYSAEELGGHGGGGEYDVQTGFGWTNGVIIEFLAKFGDKLTTSDKQISES